VARKVSLSGHSEPERFAEPERETVAAFPFAAMATESLPDSLFRRAERMSGLFAMACSTAKGSSGSERGARKPETASTSPSWIPTAFDRAARAVASDASAETRVIRALLRSTSALVTSNRAFIPAS